MSNIETPIVDGMPEDELMKALVAEFEANADGAGGAPGDAPDSTPGDVPDGGETIPATPQPVDPSTEPVPGDPIPGQPTGPETDVPPAPTPNTETLPPDNQPPTLPADPDSPDTPESAVVNVGDWSITRDEIPVIRDLYEWQRSLPPDAIEGINAFLSGQYILVPRQASQGGQNPVQGDGVAGVGSPTTTGDPASATVPPVAPAPIDPDDYLDPKAAQDIAALRQQLANMEAAAQSQQQAQAQQYQQQFNQQVTAAVTSARQAIIDKYNLTDDEYARLATTTAQRQVTDAFVRANPNDMSAGFVAALDSVYWTDPAFRQREIDRIRAAEAQQAKAISDRKAKATALSGGAAPVSRTTPSRRPSNSNEQLDQMEAFIAAASSNGN